MNLLIWIIIAAIIGVIGFYLYNKMQSPPAIINNTPEIIADKGISPVKQSFNTLGKRKIV